MELGHSGAQYRVAAKVAWDSVETTFYFSLSTSNKALCASGRKGQRLARDPGDESFRHGGLLAEHSANGVA